MGGEDKPPGQLADDHQNAEKRKRSDTISIGE